MHGGRAADRQRGEEARKNAFGNIQVDFPDGRRPVPVLLAAWAFSNYPFALALPTERTEAILAGLVAALAFFGCVPREVWWDNPTTVVAQIFKGRERRPNERCAALASRCAFEALFCMPARGNEKPYAETRVRVLQRQWATPVPRCARSRRTHRNLACRDQPQPQCHPVLDLQVQLGRQRLRRCPSRWSRPLRRRHRPHARRGARGNRSRRRRAAGA